MIFGILSSVFLHERPDSSVGIATSCRLDGRGSIPGRGKFCIFFVASIPVLGLTQPPIQWAEGEVDHSPSSSAEVKNGGSHMKSPGVEPQAPP
jgi:hypothetical protein